ncbi:MAG: NAD(P)-binding domain-containing protein [Myxococcota bacterium]
MRIAVLGTGIVGQALAGKLDALGHAVAIGTRDPAATLARQIAGPMGNPPMATWLEDHPAVKVQTFAEAAAGSEWILLAASGQNARAVLEAAGAEHLAGKVLIDITNPLDFSAGFPPQLSVHNDDSLGEQLQRAFPGAKVVKALNTVNANLMVDPARLANGAHTMLIAGDDADAKAQVTGLLTDGFGWTDVLDLGGIDNARGLEMYLPLWTRLYRALDTPDFSIRVVR